MNAQKMFRFASKKDLTSEFKCTIKLFDDNEVLECDFTSDHKGQFLLDYCYKSLNLIEKDYFGLRYEDQKQQRHWLDPTRSISKQVKALNPIVFCFRVKFYPADPTSLKEEVTRYFVYMQLRRDLLHGRLYCSSNELPLLMAYIVQSELGDYDPKEHNTQYISSVKLLPNQDEKLEKTVAEIHQKDVKGLGPSEAETLFLQKASSLESYGIDPHPVKDHKGKQLYLGVNHHGITTFQGNKKAQSFKWNEIDKLTYEGRMFIIHASTSDKKKHLLGFKCPTTSACHFLWRCAVEHRYFFTMNSSSEIPSVTTSGGLFKTSKLRYSGRVERELINDMKNIDRKEPTIQRSMSINTAPPHLRSIGRSSTAPLTHSGADRDQESPDQSQSHSKGSYPSYYYENEENHLITSNATSPQTLDSFDEDDMDTSRTSTLPTEFDLRPDITPTDDESRPFATFETPVVRNSPSASLFNRDKLSGDVLSDEMLLNDEILSQHYKSNFNRTEASGKSGVKRQSRKAYMVVRNIILSLLLLLLFFTCLLIFVIESDSDIFKPVRKIPEMIVLRKDYYEPIKNFILKKAYR